MCVVKEYNDDLKIRRIGKGNAYLTHFINRPHYLILQISKHCYHPHAASMRIIKHSRFIEAHHRPSLQITAAPSLPSKTKCVFVLHAIVTMPRNRSLAADIN